MKKFISSLLIAALSASLLCPSAFALKGIVINPSELEYIPYEEALELGEAFIIDGSEFPKTPEGTAAPADKDQPAQPADQGQVEGEPSDWAKSEVELAMEAGLVPALTGNPGYQDAITREQFAELAANLVEKTAPMVIPGDAPAFDDCDNPRVIKAASLGIVTGVGDNKFDPKTTTNREQIATMLCRAIQYIGGTWGKNYLETPANLGQFADQADISSWAAEGVGLLAANGIMKGTSDTEASPKAPGTVEQSILLVYRFYTKTI